MANKMTKKSTINDGARFSLRLPNEVLESIDQECAKRAGCVSRNTWIAEAIAEKLAKNISDSVAQDENRAA